MRFHSLRRPVLMLVALVALASIGVACSGEDSASSSSEGAKAETIKVVMKDPALFEPKDITVSAGSTVTFELTNTGLALHNMHIMSDNVEPKNAMIQPILGGDKATLVVKFPKKGTVKFQCDLHVPDMVGTITVK